MVSKLKNIYQKKKSKKNDKIKDTILKTNIVLLLVSIFGLAIVLSSFKSHAISTGTEMSLGYKNATPYKLPSDAENRKRFYLHSGDTELYAFCIQRGVSLCSTLTAHNINTSSDGGTYWKGLTATQRKGISAVAAFGFTNDGKIPTVLKDQGVNSDDMWWATQVLVWEYSTKCRTSASQEPADLTGSNTYDSCKDYYNSTKSGNAKIAYQWIIDQVRDYLKAPSFSKSSEDNATTYILHHSYENNNWSRTLTDSNSSKPVVMATAVSGVTLTHNNYDYTITSTKAISSATSLKLEKTLEGVIGNDASFVWSNSSNCQKMYTGDTPYEFYFYTKVRTEKPGYLIAYKTSDDWEKQQSGVKNIYNDVTFKIVMTTENGVSVNKEIYGPNGIYGAIKVARTSSSNKYGTLYYDSNSNGKYDSDEENIALYPGTYTLTELTPSGERYRSLISKSFSITEGTNTNLTTTSSGENGNNSGDLLNDIKEGYIDIQKYYEDKTAGSGVLVPESGAIFRIYPKDYAEAGVTWGNIPNYWKDEITTDSSGKATSKKLPYGEYIIEQTKGAANSFKVGKVTTFIQEDNKTYKYIFNDREVQAKLKIIKVDKSTQKTIPVANVTFKIRKGVCGGNGEFVSMSDMQPTPKMINEFKTDESGSVVLPGYLNYGTYCVEEVQAPSGYYNDPNAKVQITVDQSTVEAANGGNVNNYEQPIVVKYENAPQSSNLNIIKYGEELYKDDNGKSNVKKVVLPYVEFELVAAEDIKDSAGIKKYSEGQSVVTGKTNEEGKLSFNNLYFGKYYLYERSINIRKVVYSFTSAEKEQILSAYRSLYNGELFSEGSIQKELVAPSTETIEDPDSDTTLEFEIQELTDIINSKVYTLSNMEGAIYTLGDDHAILQDRFKKVLQASIDSKTITDDMIEFIENNENYLFDKDKPIETITLTSNDSKVEYISVNKEYLNQILKGKFVLTKSDMSTGKVLPNAGMRVYTEAGEVVCEGKTDKNGQLTCEKLPVGKYYFQEYGAPLGYKLDETKYPFEIKENGQTIKAKMTNAPDNINVPITSSTKTLIIYIIAGILIILGSIITICTLKRKELKSLLDKLKSKIKKLFNRKIV